MSILQQGIVPTSDVWSFQGSEYGFVSGGSNVIQRFSLTSSGNSTDWGDLTASRTFTLGCSSADYSYIAGGSSNLNIIERFSNTSSGNASDVGDLHTGRHSAASCTSSEHGYISGGSGFQNQIQRFALVSSGNGTDVGDLIGNNASCTGHSSSDYGWVSGGDPTSADNNYLNVIQKFAFASTSNATDVADLLGGAGNTYAGNSSSDYGYHSGGANNSGSYSNRIERFAFASTSNATDVGDLLGSQGYDTGVSATDYGYVCGGYGWSNSEEIQRYAFASSSNASAWGDLYSPQAWAPAGTQY